jgi:hypothetical protein
MILQEAYIYLPACSHSFMFLDPMSQMHAPLSCPFHIHASHLTMLTTYARSSDSSMMLAYHSIFSMRMNGPKSRKEERKKRKNSKPWPYRIDPALLRKCSCLERARSPQAGRLDGWGLENSVESKIILGGRVLALNDLEVQN